MEKGAGNYFLLGVGNAHEINGLLKESLAFAPTPSGVHALVA